MAHFDLSELPQARGEGTSAVIKRWSGLDVILVPKDMAALTAVQDLAAQMQKDHVKRGIVVLSSEGQHGDLNELARGWRGSGVIFAMSPSSDLVTFANRMAREFMETTASMLGPIGAPRPAVK